MHCQDRQGLIKASLSYQYLLNLLLKLQKFYSFIVDSGALSTKYSDSGGYSLSDWHNSNNIGQVNSLQNDGEHYHAK